MTAIIIVLVGLFWARYIVPFVLGWGIMHFSVQFANYAYENIPFGQSYNWVILLIGFCSAGIVFYVTFSGVFSDE